ncbi:hypothetical protein [Actinomadura xylanilytica]|uniref:hypothetical protein n=1 Tax=Actinomadura xylanilytica TaxID=887459 RepID=UPI00255B3E8D|nr:hypothetical protein [Actinomadura xylanilytica]MDL4773665.1 hypothetical protein [Actinomadura xylanilytica]
MTAVVAMDRDYAAVELRRRFPGVPVWRGESTGTWWGMARDWSGRDRLVEAPTPAALGRLLEEIGVRPRGFVPRYGHGSQTGATVRLMPSPHASRTVAPTRPAPARHARSARGGWFRRLIGWLVA